jgi:hypothetical protein
LEIQKQKELNDKRKRHGEKEKHSEEVRKQMETREYTRVNSIQSKRAQKDSVMAKTQSDKDWQLMIKREMDLIKREDKLENVERISRAQSYHK